MRIRGVLRGDGRDRGSAPIEAAIVVPLLIALALVFIAGARLSQAAQKTDAAAQAAAADALASQQQECTSTGVQADTAGLAVEVGEVSAVTVTVSCTVPLGDLLLFGGGPGTSTVESTFTSVVDAYRERG